MSEKRTYDYFVYEWQESQFLENTEIILSIAGVRGIHKILREHSKPLYLVSESFYLAYKKQLVSNPTGKRVL